MNYVQEVEARRRLQILKLMIEDGGKANDSVLLTALRAIGEGVGLDTSTVRRLMSELAERNCIATEMVRDTILVGRVTERGRMAAIGDVSIGGIASPFEGL